MLLCVLLRGVVIDVDTAVGSSARLVRSILDADDDE